MKRNELLANLGRHRDANILPILDEPTSAVNPVVVFHVQAEGTYEILQV